MFKVLAVGQSWEIYDDFFYFLFWLSALVSCGGRGPKADWTENNKNFLPFSAHNITPEMQIGSLSILDDYLATIPIIENMHQLLTYHCQIPSRRSLRNLPPRSTRIC